MTNFFEGLFGIQNFSPTSLAVFIGFLFSQMFFTMVSSTIVVDDERKKDDVNEAKIAYGGILVITSFIWMLFLLIAFIYVFKLNKK